MPKTKEEILKLVESNYYSVQKTELDVYDNNQKVDKAFVKSVKDLDTTNKSTHTKIAAETKKIKADFKLQKTTLEKDEKEHQEAIITKQTTAKEVYDNRLLEIENLYTTEVTRINEEIKVIEKEYKTLVAAVKKQYKKDIDTSNKTLTSIEEKGQKDQKTFNTRIDDLKAKYELKLESITEKETERIQKLKEASQKEMNLLETELAEKQKDYDTKLSQLNPVYEEELEEIEENLKEKEDEYRTKEDSIKSSSKQRIERHEKHLQRAIKEKDSRSQKQHKKEMDKIKKEADRDLVQLKKNYNSIISEAKAYRKTFILENIEKLATFEKSHTEYIEQQLQKMDEEKLNLEKSIANAKLDFQRQQKEELKLFHMAHTETKLKLEDALRLQQLDDAKEQNTQNKLTIEFDKTNKINEENQKEKLENKQKELKLEEFKKAKEEALAKDIYENEITTLNNESKIASLELKRDLELLVQKEMIEDHRQENKALSSNKETFLGFQSHVPVLYKTRAQEVLQFEELEINNRYKIKLTFLENQKELLKKDHTKLLERIESVYNNEKEPLEKIIQDLAGAKQEELNVFIESKQPHLDALKQEFEQLNGFKDRKKRKELEEKYNEETSRFEAQKVELQNNITSETSVYQNALNGASSRYNSAKEEATLLYETEVSNFNRSIDLLKTNQMNELDDAKLRLSQTEANAQEFLTKAASRNTLNTEENQTYLDNEINSENHIIQAKQSVFEQEREDINNAFNAELKTLSIVKEEALNEYTNNKNNAESNFETFQNNIQKQKEEVLSDNTNKLNQEQKTLENKMKDIEVSFQQKSSVINDDMSKQETDYKEALNEIEKELQKAVDTYESNRKQTEKDHEQALKDKLNHIQTKQKEESSKY